MSKLVFSSLAGLGGAVGIGGGIYLLNKNSESLNTEKRKTVKSKLQSEKFTPLNSGDSHWNKLKEEYNKVKGEASKVFKTSDSPIDENQLKELCRVALEKDEDDESYSKAKRWCVVPVDISTHLKNWNLTALPTGDSGTNGQNEWTTLSSTYNSSSHKIAGVQTLNSPEWQTLKNECKKLGDKKNYEDDFDASFSSSKIWCVKK
ncbi:hypothetical protein MHC_03290 [Mycoplasma haemocanis str. Illinois]|uniref:Uncharacterized protein n=1 Tax=Mycoplasma haemocanis (strain Illinois) TaxID=1111676 RepID=H6N796_MYCHN|nr:hypothetical protein [Mycoplasma haemocanis]AEW45518.1 hypothetical protein MHC_03290 [Mycoplasma haemocanis str. Illinois]